MKVPRWEDDKEKRALRPPLDLRERLRLGLKVPMPVIAWFWLKEQTPETGATVLTAFAAAVGGLSVVELIWLRTTTPRERIFTKSRKQAAVLHAVTVVAAIAALAYAIPRLP